MLAALGVVDLVDPESTSPWLFHVIEGRPDFSVSFRGSWPLLRILDSLLVACRMVREWLLETGSPFRSLRSLLRVPADAEEVTRGLLMRLLRRRTQLRPFSLWLRRCPFSVSASGCPVSDPPALASCQSPLTTLRERLIAARCRSQPSTSSQGSRTRIRPKTLHRRSFTWLRRRASSPIPLARSAFRQKERRPFQWTA